VWEDESFFIVKWIEKRCVTLLSSCIGSEAVRTCKTWCKQEKKKKIGVPHPGTVHVCNCNVGGTDLCAGLLAYYSSSVCTRKWPLRSFNHLLDLVVVNCWLMYHRICKVAGVSKREQLPLISYRITFGCFTYQIWGFCW
jgi:hypothetical protein